MYGAVGDLLINSNGCFPGLRRSCGTEVQCVKASYLHGIEDKRKDSGDFRTDFFSDPSTSELTLRGP